MIAEVAVFGFTLKPNTYSYLVPKGLTLSPGQLITVPFGNKLREGIILGLSKNTPKDFKLKEIKEAKSDLPILTEAQLKLASWIAKNYFVSVAEALHLMLPRTPKISNRIYQSIKKSSKQELLLFPTLQQAKKAAQISSGTVFSHALGASEFDKTWNEIATGSAKVVVGTRSALFAPFYNLAKITIFQTESDLYKEERHPYYRTFDVSLALKTITGAKLSAVSYSPRVQDQYHLDHQIKKVETNYKTEIINLKRQPTINSELIETLSKTNGRVLVFLNRKSEKGPLLCRTCKVRSYVSDPSTCPNCGSADVKFQSINLASLESQIKKQVKTNATFATQQIFFQNPTQFDLVVVLSADTYLTLANYLSTEKTFQLVTNLIRLLTPGGHILVQTAFPDQPCLSLALKNDYENFYQEELDQRRKASYPPFNQLAKLTYAKKIDSLPEPDLPEELEVFGPFTGAKWSYFIVRGEDLSPLAKLERPWKLDIDPLNL